MIKQKVVSGLCSCALVTGSLAMPVLADAAGTANVPEGYAAHFAFDDETYKVITTKPNGQDPTADIAEGKSPKYTEDTERGHVLDMSAGDYGIDTGYDLPSGSYTVSLWAKPTSEVTKLTPTVCLDANTYNSTNGVASQSWHRITTYGEWNEYKVTYYQTSTQNFTSAWSLKKDDAVLNKWNMYTVTYDLTNEATGKGELTLYFNGEEITGASNCNPQDVCKLANAANVLVGINPWSNGDGLYKGYIDDMYVYTKALTPGEVYQIYSGIEPGNVIVHKNTQQNCTIEVPTVKTGEKLTITVRPETGYEAAKLNINGATVKLTTSEDGTAAYTIDAAPESISVDAWADPVDNRLEMTALTEKPNIETITSFGTLPDEWSDNDVTTFADFRSYAGMAIFDAEAAGNPGDRYKLDRVITYARWNMPGRSHLKIFGTNDPLTAEMFTADNGANSGKLTALTHGDNNDEFFGTGSYTDNSSSGTDAVRGEYEVNGNESYRYIIVHSDHKNMLSLGELKFYGSTVHTAPQTHDSDYFGFSATADEMNTFKKIAIKLNDDTTMTADFNAGTVFQGSGIVQYAINITDLAEGTEVTDVKLYVD